jgi:sulfite reductase alpha subunit-like flavoprotein
LQDVAERVAREAQLLLYTPSIMPMDSYPIQQLPEERFVIFVTATTGQARVAGPRRLALLTSTVFSIGHSQHKEHAVSPTVQQQLPPRAVVYPNRLSYSVFVIVQKLQ